MHLAEERLVYLTRREIFKRANLRQLTFRCQGREFRPADAPGNVVRDLLA